VTDPSNVNYEPNLLTVKEQVGATIMGSNANRILAKGDDYDLKIHVRLFTTDQTKADYVRNNVTMEYSLVDGSDNVVDNLTGLYDLIEEELVDAGINARFLLGLLGLVLGGRIVLLNDD
jgi:hypothetical protein